MIQENEKFEVEGTIGGLKVRMGIHEAAHGVVMDILSNMYADKLRAMIREYSTNAFDAHVEAGQTRPIEVTLPGALAPFLKIRDFGTGLTVDGIERIYSQYGASTKRESNSMNGTFGIGCKAALAYCSQFTVTSVKDGVKIVVAVGREEDGGGSMSVVDSRPTDEPNGTEVTIPVARGDIDPIIEKARGFYRFWKPGTVLVDGKQPESFEGLKLTDDIFVVDDESSSLIVMGNVPYPAPGLNSLVPSSAVVAFVPIGAVNIPPPRESLQDTKTTRATIEDIKRRFNAAIKGAIQREVDACATPQDAIRTVVKWGKHISRGAEPSNYSYNGAQLPATMRLSALDPGKASYLQPEAALMIVSQARDHRPGSSWRETSISVRDWPSTLWITDFAPDKYTAQHKRKMLKWCADNGLAVSSYGVALPDVTQFVMARGSFPASPFIDPARIVPWEDIRKIKLPVNRKTVGGTARIPGSYDIWTEDGFKAGVPGDDLRQEHPIFYYKGNARGAVSYKDAIKVYYPHYTLVCLPLNRVAKFNRILPNAKEAREAIKDEFATWAATVTEDQKKALALDSRDPRDRRSLAQMDAGKIDDPALQDAVRIAKIDVSSIRTARKTFERYICTDVLDVTSGDPFEHYPLIEGYGFSALITSDPQHIYTYINAAYAAR